jgi:ABC-2 type transport system ATP-binding protein
MKQRLGIASSIIHSPELVFFDEPMSGLDPLGRNLVKNLIKELKEQ